MTVLFTLTAILIALIGVGGLAVITVITIHYFGSSSVDKPGDYDPYSHVDANIKGIARTYNPREQCE